MMTSLLWVSLAFAGEFDTKIDEAKAAIKAGDYKEVGNLLKKAKQAAPNEKRLLSPMELANIYFLEGIALSFQDGAYIPSFRKALILYPKLEFPNEFVDYKKGQGKMLYETFLAIQAEVTDREKIDMFIPEKYGMAKLYVDGVQRSYGDSGVPLGEHFLQVECPKGDYFAKWSKLAKDPKWIKICPYKFDVNDMPKVEDDIFADFDADIPDVANEEPVVAEPEKTKETKKPKEEPKPPAEEPTDAQAQIDIPTDPLEKQRVPAKVWEKINKPLLVGAGVSAIAAGAVYYLAVQDRMAFDDPSNPDVLMPEDLEVLRDSTNTKVYVSAGLGVSAVGLYTAAFWKVRF